MPLKKFNSKKIGRDYYVHRTKSVSVDLIPCFNEAEISLVKELNAPNQLLNIIFDTKELLNSELIDVVRFEDKELTEANVKNKIAERAASIAETIRAAKIRTEAR